MFGKKWDSQLAKYFAVAAKIVIGAPCYYRVTCGCRGFGEVFFQIFLSLITEVAAGIIGAHRGIQDILCAMRKFPEDLEIVSNCVTIIMSLSLIGQFCKQLIMLMQTL